MNDLPSTEYRPRGEPATAPHSHPLASSADFPHLAAPGVSWSAVLAGAVTAAAVALILTVLGVGLGLSSVSPWSAHATVEAIGVSAIAWLLASQGIAAGLGGYLAGRLRVKWLGVHTDEVYFRDTAHGFLAWALGIVITAAFLAGAVSSILGTTTRVAAGAAAASAGLVAAAGAPAMNAQAGGASSGATSAGQSATSPAGRTGNEPGNGEVQSLTDAKNYIIDVLLRPAAGTTAASAGNGFANPVQDTRREATGVLFHAVSAGALSNADRAYLTQLVTNRTGVDSTEAGTRVDDAFNKARALAQDTVTKAKDAADAARRATAKASLWIFVALLLGAFLASLAATLGGRQRDSDLAMAV